MFRFSRATAVLRDRQKANRLRKSALAMGWLARGCSRLQNNNNNNNLCMFEPSLFLAESKSGAG